MVSAKKEFIVVDQSVVLHLCILRRSSHWPWPCKFWPWALDSKYLL